MIGPWTYIFGFCVFFQQKKKKNPYVSKGLKEIGWKFGSTGCSTFKENYMR